MAKPESEYNRKRNFNITTEPPDEISKSKRGAHALSFVIQKHDARRLHYDFRLELDGTLKSWAIPKGPSLDPSDKRLAVHVEDHPISYSKFEGSIPHGQYGGGDVIVWDHGVWQPHGDANAAYKSGKLKFTLIGEKLTGDWTLVRTNFRGNSDKEQWLLIKERDEVARPASEYDIVEDQPHSVITGDLLPADKIKTGESKKSKISSEKKVLEEKVSETAASKAQTKKQAAKEIDKQAEKKTDKQTEKKIDKQAIKKIVEKNAEPESVKKPAKTSRSKKTATLSTPLPAEFSPELATLVTEPPEGNWLYEIKFDGYRILTRILNGEVRLFTRKGHDWTDKLPLQAKAIEALNLGDSWLDGEVVVLNAQGLPDFQALQNAFDIGRSHDIIYYLFDAPFLNGTDLREAPVEERRAELEKIVPGQRGSLLRFSAAFGSDHRSIVQSACAMSLEGLIGKRAGSPYVSRRSNEWIKLKCRLRQEFIIVGYTQPQGSRSGFGALLLGVYEDLSASENATGKNKAKPELLYAGRVGTGFNESRLQDIFKKMRPLERATSPVKTKLNSTQARGVQWVEPTLVCEVEFAEWTGEGILRQAAFLSLRTDKPAKEIIREKAKSPNAVKLELPGNAAAKKSSAKSKSAADKSSAEKVGSDAEETKANEATKPKSVKLKNGRVDVAGVQVSHPERVIDTEHGGTKLDLAEFYNGIADFILPHLNNRPVSLLRAPDGVVGEQFFQKHSEHLAIPNIKQLDPALDPGHARLMEIDTVEALVGAVQMGTIELHTWGAITDQIETPDRIVLDLDPDPVLPWRSMIEATRLTLSVLDELKLEAFLKTTGGKGMHIIIPLTPDAGWESVKEFSKAIAQFMAKQIPERFVAKMGPKNRIGKIFIDYLRNTRGASTVSAYSVRARPGLPVSVPIARDELETLTHSNQWHIGNLHERLDKLKTNPWGTYTGSGYKKRQKITKAMWKKLGATEPTG